MTDEETSNISFDVSFSLDTLDRVGTFRNFNTNIFAIENPGG